MNYTDKKVLLIGGNGTLGRHVCNELLKLGCSVEILCRSAYTSDNPKLSYRQASAGLETLTDLLKDNHYDGIVNFMHYPTLEEYIPVHKVLMDGTDHLIFLSSYRVYGNEQIPITESAPRLLETVDDPEFLAKEDYALPKCRCEDFMKKDAPNGHWTAVRPVICSSQKRFDIFTHSDHYVIACAKEGKALPVPQEARNLTAGIDWAGNGGKLIAHLLFKPETFGQTYTVSTGQNLTWGQIADIYTELLGAKFEWVPMEVFLADSANNQKHSPWAIKYDRMCDRKVDVSKIMAVTGLKPSDFLSVKEGIAIELAKVQK